MTSPAPFVELTTSATGAETPPLPLELGVVLVGVGPDDDSVRDLHDLVHRKTGQTGVLPDRLRTRRLVDAHRPHAAPALVQDVAADPAHLVRHLLVTHLRRSPAGHLQLGSRFPPAAPKNRVQLHAVFSSWLSFPGGRWRDQRRSPTRGATSGGVPIFRAGRAGGPAPPPRFACARRACRGSPRRGGRPFSRRSPAAARSRRSAGRRRGRRAPRSPGASTLR